jgi:radical SAM protein with 4Fe4S-binding SPASM domain
MAFYTTDLIEIQIENSSICNAACPQCIREFKEPTKDWINETYLDISFFENIPDEVYQKLKIFYFTGNIGDPCTAPNFLEVCKFVRAKNPNMFIKISTNGGMKSPDFWTQLGTILGSKSEVIFAIDGLEDTNHIYRVNVKWDKVMANAQAFITAGGQAFWQFIAFKHNEHQIPEIKKLAKEIGVDELGIKTAQIYDYQTSNEFIPENEDLSRYSKTETGYQIKNKLLNQCWRMWRGSVITWDGLVVPCCFDKDATHRFGNISKQSFKSVWTGEQYNNFRKAILKSRKEIDICTNCTEGTKVWN